MNNMFKILSFLIASALLFMACGSSEDVTPKPRAYYRIDLPQKEYIKFDTLTFPYSFEYPSLYGEVEMIGSNQDNKYWLNLNFPKFGGTIYLTYKYAKEKKDILHHIDTCSEFMTMHYQKSSGVAEREYVNSENKIYASIYHIKGTGVATPYQFWITDSIHHFLRGALYFNQTPNNDSIAPVIDYLAKDIEQLINTLHWKN